jgi:hypothetical protein
LEATVGTPPHPQVRLSKDMYELAWSTPIDPAKNQLALSGTYYCPPNGNANFPELNYPKAVWYFCGLMPDYEPPPPFSDSD